MSLIVPKAPLTCAFVQEISQQAAHDGLVADDQHVLLPLQLHDDGFQPLHQVLVGLGRGTSGGRGGPQYSACPFFVSGLGVGAYLAFGVTITVFILVAEGEFFGVALLDLLVGHLLADALWGDDFGGSGGLISGCFTPKKVRGDTLLTASISFRAFHCS